jgi:GNAT superfamily N-acetyltransferase
MTDGAGFHLRHGLRPGDCGRIVARHGEIYADEHGFDVTFEAYVAGPLAAAVRRADPRERIWIAEDAARRFLGCVAVVAATPETAQLRWYLVEPAARGRGLGTRLLAEAVAFAGARGYRSVILWTVGALTAAARRYAAAGFAKVEEKPGRQWGVDVVEEKWERGLEGDSV